MTVPCCRYAPEPTGPLRLDGAHTAVFCWLIAKTVGAAFKIRIEDSNPLVSSRRVAEGILDDLAWLGLVDDTTEILWQSARHEDGVYRERAERLLTQGLATEEDSNDGSGKVIVYHPRESLCKFHDELRGELPRSSDGHALKPAVILRHDGTPLYNFGCVVDDIDMGTTHVVRGEHMIPSTFFQVSLYAAFGASLPKFYHLPTFQDERGHAMSKSRALGAISDLRRNGFLPDGIVAYLSALGMSNPERRAIGQRGSCVESFSLDDMRTSAIRHDSHRLHATNRAVLQRVQTGKLVSLYKDYLAADAQAIHPVNESWLVEFLEEYRPRATTLADLVKQHTRFVEHALPARDLVTKHVTAIDAASVIGEMSQILSRVRRIDGCMLALRRWCTTNDMSVRAAAQCLRVVLVGSDRTTGLDGLLFLLGRDEAIRRLTRWQKALTTSSRLSSTWLVAMQEAIKAAAEYLGGADSRGAETAESALVRCRKHLSAASQTIEEIREGYADMLLTAMQEDQAEFDLDYSGESYNLWDDNWQHVQI